MRAGRNKNVVAIQTSDVVNLHDLRENRRKWDDRYLQLAQHVSHWSKDPKAHVGAVVVDAQGCLYAAGYNGFPRKVEDSESRLGNQTTKLSMIIHAEANAITIAGRGAAGGEIYVFGKPVCAQCAGLIIQSGIRRVVAEKPTRGAKSKWDKLGILAEQILRESGATVLFSGVSRQPLSAIPDDGV